MKIFLFIFVCWILFTFLFSTDLYYGPGQKYANFETAFETAMSGDHIIDCTLKDMKILPGNHWSWVSFPRLERIDDKSADARAVLSKFQNYPFDMELLYDYFLVLEYNIMWTPTRYDIRSSIGYKLNPQKSGTHHLQIDGTRLPPDWKLTSTLPARFHNWMGYWLPYTQNIEDAFGEFWDDVYSVEAEDWYYEYSIHETPTSTTTNKSMVYGKAYIVVFDEDAEDFYWTDDIEEAEQRERMDSEYFSYNDLPNYEAIDVLDIPENVLEIGVFEDDVCVGAVVIQDTCEQILVYSTNANRDQIPFSFEIVTNTRGVGTPITSYQVLNKETGLFEERSLISGQHKSSVVMFTNPEEP